jgi:hypothetical protein
VSSTTVASFNYFQLYFAAFPLLHFILIIVSEFPIVLKLSPHDKDKRFLLLSYFVFVCLFVVDVWEALLSLSELLNCTRAKVSLVRKFYYFFVPVATTVM